MQSTMKPFIQIVIGLVLVLAIAGCQSATPTTAPASSPESYPEPQQDQVVAEPPDTLYPDIASGSEVSWSQAYGLVMNGEVSQVLQANAEKITLVLKDGRSLQAVQPAAGDIARAIEACGEPCAAIQVSQ